MKELKTLMKYTVLSLSIFLFIQPLFAQGYGEALTYQGVDHFLLQSAASRAMGGISIGLKQDIGLMFQNPAALASMGSIQISAGGQLSYSDLKQEQNYAPVRYYSNLALLLESRTDQIPDPDPTLFGFTAQDTVQRPYDNIQPNWTHSNDNNIPLQALVAVPFSFGTFRFTAGMGAVTYADLNHYYQNNNGLSPDILSQRPLPTLRPTDDDPIEVRWFKSYRMREGSIQGYGFAMAGKLDEPALSLGISGMVLKGSSDDEEQQAARGNLTFFSNAFRADSLYSITIKKGSSDYSGLEFTLSAIWRGRFVSAGFSLKPPTTITRSFNMRVMTDSMGITSRMSISGEDKLKLPWRGMIGLSFALRDNLTLGLEYEFRPYDAARYISSEGTETSPWLPVSLFRVGAEYMIAPWLVLRGGMRGEAEVFEPAGSQLSGEPVSYTIYSGGLGLMSAGLHLTITYEYAAMKYADTWASALSKNTDNRYTFVAQLAYELR
jgi:hypothetical protein